MGRYVRSPKTSDKGYQTLRMKMNKSRRYALQWYTPEKEKCAHLASAQAGSGAKWPKSDLIPKTVAWAGTLVEMSRGC